MRKLLWQFTVAIKSDPVAPTMNRSSVNSAKSSKVKYSAAYPTGRERLRNSEVECTVGAALIVSLLDNIARE